MTINEKAPAELELDEGQNKHDETKVSHDHPAGKDELSGADLRDLALADHAHRYAGRIAEAKVIALELLRERGTISGPDVHEALALPDRCPRWLGSVFQQLSREGVIQTAGWSTTPRRQGHARPVRLWTIAEGRA